MENDLKSLQHMQYNSNWLIGFPNGMQGRHDIDSFISYRIQIPCLKIKLGLIKLQFSLQKWQ